MPLDALHRADDQHGAVQHLGTALGLGAKIHMARRVDEGVLLPAVGKMCVAGKDSDAALPLQRGVVQHQPPRPGGGLIPQHARQAQNLL